MKFKYTENVPSVLVIFKYEVYVLWLILDEAAELAFDRQLFLLPYELISMDTLSKKRVSIRPSGTKPYKRP